MELRAPPHHTRTRLNPCRENSFAQAAPLLDKKIYSRRAYGSDCRDLQTRWRAIPLVWGLECLIERLRQRSGSVGVGGVDVGQGRIERLVTKRLSDQKGVEPLPDHQHGRRVL